MPLVTRLFALVIAAALAACGDVQESNPSKTYLVGPGRDYATLAAVAPLLEAGDTVLVDGNASYDPIVFQRSGSAERPITVRGVRVNGKRPIVSGGATTVHFKNAHHILFEGFEITGGTSRCVYHEGDDITIRDSVIHDCPAHGILSADRGSGSLTLSYNEIFGCGAGDQRHCIYAATDEVDYPGSRFRMEYCYLHDANGGNMVKSRAERNEIYYNWIEGARYHQLELIGPDPEAGVEAELKREDSDVVGNVIYGAPNPTQPGGWYLIRIGGDGTGDTGGRYRFVNNTFIFAAGVSQAAFRIFDRVESLEVHNNLFARVGGGGITVARTVEVDWTTGEPIIAGSRNWLPTGSEQVPPDWVNTLTGAEPGLSDLSKLAFWPAATSVLVGAGTRTPMAPSGHEVSNPLVVPAFEPPRGQLLPLGTGAPRPSGTAIDIGAFGP